jgi:regulator of protease activity HflC (stomatin/prohibitin superfamily)
MTDRAIAHETKERAINAWNGWLMLCVVMALFIGTIVLAIATIAAGANAELTPAQVGWRLLAALIVFAAALIMSFGFFTLQPNEARVQILFGSYKGTVTASGFHWANPFYSRSRGKDPNPRRGDNPASKLTGLAMQPGLPTKISLRVHNFNSDKLKVNDKRGNPVEIAAVVVWRVTDTAQAVFDVDDYESFVHVQSESAIRGIASQYAYDQGDDDEITLRGGATEIADELQKELQARLEKAGVVVDEARLTHLAYAPEIASAMLRRQQAEAVIAARAKIVLGAVSMVEMALNELDDKGVVNLDEERRAAMVSNLLVVLCGTAEASPVINTGTLYN